MYDEAHEGSKVAGRPQKMGRMMSNIYGRNNLMIIFMCICGRDGFLNGRITLLDIALLQGQTKLELFAHN